MATSSWLPLALFALVAWTAQRLLSKVALKTLGTAKFYLLSAIVSLLAYTPYLILHPPARHGLAPAFGLACLMALTFWVTTEAIRRGPLGSVSPLTSLGPAITAGLAITVLGERLEWPAYVGVVLATGGVFAISLGPRSGGGRSGWLWLAIASLVLQGVGAFLAKLVVTDAGPSGLLLLAPALQIAVGLVLSPPSSWRRADLAGRAAIYTVIGYLVGGFATVGYLVALSRGPAALVVPLVATSPALAGLVAIAILQEPVGRSQLAGIGLALAGAVLLSTVA